MGLLFGISVYKDSKVIEQLEKFNQSIEENNGEVSFYMKDITGDQAKELLNLVLDNKDVVDFTLEYDNGDWEY